MNLVGGIFRLIKSSGLPVAKFPIHVGFTCLISIINAVTIARNCTLKTGCGTGVDIQYRLVQNDFRVQVDRIRKSSHAIVLAARLFDGLAGRAA